MEGRELLEREEGSWLKRESFSDEVSVAFSEESSERGGWGGFQFLRGNKLLQREGVR